MVKKIKIPGAESAEHSNPGQQMLIRSLLKPDSLIKEGMAAGKKTLAGIGGEGPGKKLGAR